jgi:hypothetical protein
LLVADDANQQLKLKVINHQMAMKMEKLFDAALSSDSSIR